MAAGDYTHYVVAQVEEVVVAEGSLIFTFDVLLAF
jgi:hypothetical protein